MLPEISLSFQIQYNLEFVSKQALEEVISVAQVKDQKLPFEEVVGETNHQKKAWAAERDPATSSRQVWLLSCQDLRCH